MGTRLFLLLPLELSRGIIKLTFSWLNSPANPLFEQIIHTMSQQSEFLDDSDLEDEAFLLELEQQVSPKSGVYSSSPATSLQQRQLTTIL